MTINNPEASAGMERVTQVRQGVETLGRRALNTLTRKGTETHPPAAKKERESPEQHQLRVMGTLKAIAFDDGNLTPEQGKMKQENPLHVMDNDVKVSLSLEALAGYDQTENFDFHGRNGIVTNIVSLQGDRVVCMVNIPSENGLGGTGNESIQVTMSRRALFLAQMEAENGAVKAFMDTQPDGPEKKALELYIRSQKEPQTLSAKQAEQEVAEIAKQSRLLTVDNLWEGFMTDEIGPDPQVEYNTAHSKWEAEKKAAESATPPQPFDKEEPAAPPAEKIAEYNQKKDALAEKEARFKQIFQGQMIAEPASIVEFLTGELADPQFLQGKVETLTKDLQTMETELARQQDILENPGEHVQINPETRQNEKVDTKQTKRRIEILKMKTRQLKRSLEAISKINDPDNFRQKLTDRLTQLQNGELAESESQSILEDVDKGSTTTLMKLAKKQLEEECIRDHGQLTEQDKKEIQDKLAEYERIDKLIGIGRAAGLGLLAVIVMALMQGLGAGASQQG